MRKNIFFLAALIVIIAFPAAAEEGGFGSRLQKLRAIKERSNEQKAAVLAEPDVSLTRDNYGGREILLHIAPNVPSPGRRAMVVVLHGGMGNAGHIQPVIGMDTPADEGGFIVAYLNGSQATRLNKPYHAWNAGGGCCGQPFERNVDDVGYITSAVKYIAQKYGVDLKRVYGMGHSNGAMMTQRLMCETDLYQAAIPIAGPLNMDVSSCPQAKGKKIWAIHGELDENLPVGGGFGSKGVTDIDFKSQQYAQKIFTQSGADYRLDIVKGTDHGLKNIADAIERRDQRTLGREAALFFGLAPK